MTAKQTQRLATKFRNLKKRYTAWKAEELSIQKELFLIEAIVKSSGNSLDILNIPKRTKRRSIKV